MESDGKNPRLSFATFLNKVLLTQLLMLLVYCVASMALMRFLSGNFSVGFAVGTALLLLETVVYGVQVLPYWRQAKEQQYSTTFFEYFTKVEAQRKTKGLVVLGIGALCLLTWLFDANYELMLGMAFPFCLGGALLQVFSLLTSWQIEELDQRKDR